MFIMAMYNHKLRSHVQGVNYNIELIQEVKVRCVIFNLNIEVIQEAFP